MIALEVTLSDGAKLALHVWESEEDGAPVVQIDTDPDTQTHERLRVYVNDANMRARDARLRAVQP